MMQDDPLLNAYREAAWIYFHVSDMPPDVRTSFLVGACAGKDLVRSSVQALFGESGTTATSVIPASAGADDIAETLHRFMHAITSGAHSDVTPYVPSADAPHRERILVELIKRRKVDRPDGKPGRRSRYPSVSVMPPLESSVPYFRERSFGLSVGGVLVLIAAVLLWRGRVRYAEVAGAVGVVLILLGRMKPSLLEWPSAAWWRLALILAYVNSRIILTLAFALLLTPIGLIWRAIGRDPLARRRDRSPGWTPHPARYRAPGHYTRMY